MRPTTMVMPFALLMACGGGDSDEQGSGGEDPPTCLEYAQALCAKACECGDPCMHGWSNESGGATSPHDDLPSCVASVSRWLDCENKARVVVEECFQSLGDASCNSADYPGTVYLKIPENCSPWFAYECFETTPDRNYDADHYCCQACMPIPECPVLNQCG